MSETPLCRRPGRLAKRFNATDAKKVYSFIDKIYKRKNLEIAWEKGSVNRGNGGVDGQTLEPFGEQLDPPLDRLQSELRAETYKPQPVRRVPISKVAKPGEFRELAVPIIYDRVCQQALLNPLEPMFEPVFDEAVASSPAEHPILRGMAGVGLEMAKDRTLVTNSSTSAVGIEERGATDGAAEPLRRQVYALLGGPVA